MIIHHDSDIGIESFYVLFSLKSCVIVIWMSQDVYLVHNRFKQRHSHTLSLSLHRISREERDFRALGETDHLIACILYRKKMGLIRATLYDTYYI